MVGLDSRDAIAGKTDFDFARDDQHAESYRSWDAKIMDEGKAVLDILEPYDTADGGRGYVVTSKIPVRDRDGTVTGILGVCTDITTTKRLETELQSLYESFPDAYLVIRSDGQILDCNPAAERLLRGEREEILGRSVLDISPEVQWNLSLIHI